MLALNPPLNSNKPVTAACTKAVVAILVESSPEAGVCATALAGNCKFVGEPEAPHSANAPSAKLIV